jgi:hypothetical protein
MKRCFTWKDATIQWADNNEKGLRRERKVFSLEVPYWGVGVDLKLGKRHSLWGDNAGTKSQNDFSNSNMGADVMSR